MSELSSRQRSHLRSLAHGLDPVVFVGHAGVTAAVVREIDDALAARELIKVKLVGDRNERAESAESVATRTGAALAGLIGRVAILYRPSPEPERRRIDLPS